MCSNTMCTSTWAPTVVFAAQIASRVEIYVGLFDPRDATLNRCGVCEANVHLGLHMCKQVMMDAVAI